MFGKVRTLATPLFSLNRTIRFGAVCKSSRFSSRRSHSNSNKAQGRQIGGIMKRYFSNQDLQKVFEYLTKSGGLSLVRVKGRNTGDVSSHVSQIIRFPENADNIFPIARLVGSDTETLLFESHFVEKFRKAIEKRSRTGDLSVQELTVTKPDAATAIDFYLNATFQARDFIHLILAVVTRLSSWSDKRPSRRRKAG